MINYAASDTLMAIFGYKRVKRCPYCDRNDIIRLQCWRAKKRKLVCPKQDGRKI